MKLHRFIGEFAIAPGQLTVTDWEMTHQIRDVLRLSAGDNVILCDGKKREAQVQILEIRGDSMVVEAGGVTENTKEPAHDVVLYCSVLKGEHFEYVVEKATEVGVREIMPIVTSRTVKLQFRHERLAKIIKEAAEQSGRGIIPLLHAPTPLDEAVELAKKNKLNIFFDGNGTPFNKEPFSIERMARIGAFIGPEGGWTEEEIEVAREAGFCTISLGERTLRAETAAVIASFLLISTPHL